MAATRKIVTPDNKLVIGCSSEIIAKQELERLQKLNPEIKLTVKQVGEKDDKK